MSNLALAGGGLQLPPDDYLRIARNIIAAVEGLASKVGAIDGRMTSLEVKVDNEIFINYNQQRAVQKAVGRRVRDMLPSDVAYRESSKIYYAALYSALKDVYQVPSYREIPRTMFTHAMQYIQNWEYQGAA